MSKKISIIIPTLGNVVKLKRLLGSIALQDFSVDQFEVWVIANGIDVTSSLESSLGYYAFDMHFKFIKEKGVNRARNLGLELACAPIVMYIDDDCELHMRHMMSYHVNTHFNNQDMFALGGGYLAAPTAKYFDDIYHFIQMNWFYTLSDIQDGQFVSTGRLLGGNFSIKKNLISDPNFKITFDENISYGSSETAFFNAADKLNLKMFKCPLDVTHHTQESFYSLIRKLKLQGAGQAYIDMKYKIIKEKHKSNIATHAQTSIIFNFLIIFYNYVFWYGYFSAKNKTYLLFYKVLTDLLGNLNQLRFKILNRVNKE